MLQCELKTFIFICNFLLTHRTLDKIFSRQHLNIFFIFLRKQNLTFHANSIFHENEKYHQFVIC